MTISHFASIILLFFIQNCTGEIKDLLIWRTVNAIILDYKIKSADSRRNVR
jgi:hypothetical protein